MKATENDKGRRARGWHLILCALLSASAALLSCDKDKSAKPPVEPSRATVPTLRIYALSGPAGAIEPCGCVKDMLGGIDHAAAFIQTQKQTAPHSLVLGAGPMFFEDPQLSGEEAKQGQFKAETMAEALGDLGLDAWAPGGNDWASGVGTFADLVGKVGVRPVAANLDDKAGPLHKSRLFERGGSKIGVVGVSIPERLGEGVEFPTGDAQKALTEQVQAVQQKGAQITVALLAAQRGVALRLLESVQDQALIQLAIVGKPFDQGEGNDEPFSPEMVGKTLVVQSPNHLQSIAVIDLYVKDGNYRFVDGGGLDREAQKQRLDRRIEELAERIKTWRRRGSVKAEDLAAQEKNLAELRLDRKQLEDPVVPPPRSYFTYRLVDVKESHGQDAQVAARMAEYYKRVNQHNKQAFADRLPPVVEEGEPSYVGVDACTKCHEDQRAFWDTTGHAHAYETLSSQHKEFNLDCVSCHVTGYEQPGGSTVTHVEQLKDVGCEVCHGAGSLHVATPDDPKLIQSSPRQHLCAESCHHPPHVGQDWDVVAAWRKIVGPGHGQPKNDGGLQ